MGAVAADVVLVLGDVGEMREIGEGAHDGERLVVVEAVEDGGKFAPRPGLVVAMEADRGLTDALDEVEGLAPFMLAHGVAEQAPEQADVLAQRRVLLGLGGGIEGDHIRHGGFPVDRPVIASEAKQSSAPVIERQPSSGRPVASSLRSSQ